MNTSPKSSQLESFLITNHMDLERQLDVEASVGVHSVGRSVEVGGGWVDAVKVYVRWRCECATRDLMFISQRSHDTVTYVLRLAVDHGISYVQSPQLTKNALKILVDRGQKAFESTFGQYYLAGSSLRSEYMVIYRISAGTSEELASAKAEIRASLPQTLDVHTDTRFKERLARRNLAVEITYKHTGVNSLPAGLALKDREEALAWHERHASGTPRTAIFAHYANLVPEYISLVVPDLSAQDFSETNVGSTVDVTNGEHVLMVFLDHTRNFSSGSSEARSWPTLSLR